MLARSRLVLVVALFACACTSNPPVPSVPSAAPPSTSPPSATASPVSVSPTPAHSIPLTVTGEGSCTVENYGGCWPVLLMTHGASDTFASWKPSASDVVFATADAGYPTTQLTGRVMNGPSQIALGHWSVGMGLARGSDVPDQPDYGTVICHQEFDVTPTTTSVRISASLSGYDGCDLRVDLTDPSAHTPSTRPSGSG